MVDAFICFKEWMSKTNTKRVSQQILDSVAGDVISPVVQRRSVIPREMKRLTEHHFFRKIPTTGQNSRSCSVCSSRVTNGHVEMCIRKVICNRYMGHYEA